MYLDQLLEDLTVDFEPFTVCRVGLEVGLDMGMVGEAALHFVTSGQGILRIDDKVVSLEPGVVLITYPGARLQALAGDARNRVRLSGLPCKPLSEGRSDSDDTGDLVMVCGALSAVYQGSQGLFDQLDAPLVARLAPDDEICHTLGNVLDELEVGRVGAHAMARSLLERCLILLLRRECRDGDCTLPWMAALRDERMSRALVLIRSRITSPPSVRELADVAGMVRSTFLRRFLDTFGRSPRKVSIGIRMDQAASLLRTGDAPIKTVAARTGFLSRSHFSRSFKRTFDQSPEDYRRQNTGPAPG
ncbi:MAG: helix-turn-helix domain-containing protein [Rhodospirillaceae bacterium]|nr:helix-turn-helix domain-containing protein [Rhodospirillaceae bacterium]